MKNTIHFVLLLTFGFGFSSISTASAQKFSKLDKSPLDVIIVRNDQKKPLARVIYSRPQKKGRTIFGELVAFDKLWRTGANEATEISLYQNMFFGNKEIVAGNYTIFTIPSEKNWDIILYSETNLWGSYDYNKEKEVARITVPSKTSPALIEAFSMVFQTNENGISLFMGWDSTFVAVPFTDKPL